MAKVVDGQIEWLKDEVTGVPVGFKKKDGTEGGLVTTEVNDLTGVIKNLSGPNGDIGFFPKLTRSEFANPFAPGFSFIGVDRVNGPAGNNVSVLLSSYAGSGGSIVDSQSMGTTFYANTTGAPIWKVIVTNGGTGATAANGTAITGTTGGGGSGFTGTLKVSGGVITGIIVTSGGTGYNAQPTAFTLASGAVGSGFTFVVLHQEQGVNINQANTNLNRGLPLGGAYPGIKKFIQFGNTAYLGGVAGTPGQVHTCYVTNGGSGYTDGQYPITFSGGGGTGGAGFALVVGGKVVCVYVSAGGSGYTGNPTLAGLSGGTGATFFVQIGARGTIWQITNYVTSLTTPGAYWAYRPVWQAAAGSDDFIPTAFNADASYMYFGEYGTDSTGLTVSAGTGLQGGPGVYRSADGVSWEQIFGPVNSATAKATNSGSYVATFTSTGGVRNHCHCVYPDPYNAGTIYITCGDGGVLANVWIAGYSTDFGRTWTRITNNARYQSVQISASALWVYFASDTPFANVFVMNRGEKVMRVGSMNTIDQINYPGATPRPTASGFADGVCTSGSTTFTSATASFSSASDVGRMVICDNLLPAWTFIMSVTNSTTVVLSNPATGNGSSRPFEIGPSRWAWPAPTGAIYGLVDPQTEVFYLNVADPGTGSMNPLRPGVFALNPFSKQFNLLNPMSWTTGMPLQEVFTMNGYLLVQNNRFALLTP